VLVLLLAGLAAIARAQGVVEFTTPTLNAGPQCITPGPDGNMWFAERSPNKIGRINPSGTITEFSVNAPYRVQCITAGQDGNLWFTVSEVANGQIGKITPDGVVTLLPTVLPLTLYSITSGPDGALWFTGAASNVSKIGRITTDGVITEFTVPSPNGSFSITSSIASGHEDLWFTESDGSKIGRITTDGVITEFAALPGSTPSAIVREVQPAQTSCIFIGIGCKHWFTEADGNKIAHFSDTSGTVLNEYPIPTPACAPQDVSQGPDGAFWFTERNGNKIGRITGAGAVTELQVPTASSEPFGIRAGPDGNIWFTEYQASKIGRIIPGSAPSGCVPETGLGLFLSAGRFKVEVCWSVPSEGRNGFGTPMTLTGDTGYFWFFDSSNIELVIKVLDGRAVNGHFWVFYGALSNVQYTIKVTEIETGIIKLYENPSGTLASVADTTAFTSTGATVETPGATSAEEIETRSAEELYGLYAALTGAVAPKTASAGCTPGGTTLCLNQSRFQVTVDWDVPSQGTSGHGSAVSITGDTGYFWFFDSSNIELVVKVLDGQAINGHFWVFYGGISSVQYTITVTDTATGTVHAYTNSSGQLASVADTAAF
jgi:virginiamycin B lyase